MKIKTYSYDELVKRQHKLCPTIIRIRKTNESLFGLYHFFDTLHITIDDIDTERYFNLDSGVEADYISHFYDALICDKDHNNDWNMMQPFELYHAEIIDQFVRKNMHRRDELIIQDQFGGNISRTIAIVIEKHIVKNHSQFMNKMEKIKGLNKGIVKTFEFYLNIPESESILNFV